MMKNLKKVCFGCLVVACAVRLSASDISLDGIWKLSYRHQQEGGEWTILEAPVPGDTNEALVKAGVLPDPKVGTNVFVHLPAEQYEWKYERTFPGVLPEQGGRQILQFDGVDTRAEYFLNGERLGASLVATASEGRMANTSARHSIRLAGTSCHALFRAGSGRV